MNVEQLIKIVKLTKEGRLRKSDEKYLEEIQEEEEFSDESE